MRLHIPLWLGTAAWLAGLAPALAEGGESLGQVEIGTRFKLVEMDQLERNLNQASTRINVLFDTQSGRSWVLRHTVKPGGNETGYVWVEIPFAPPPK